VSFFRNVAETTEIILTIDAAKSLTSCPSSSVRLTKFKIVNDFTENKRIFLVETICYANQRNAKWRNKARSLAATIALAWRKRQIAYKDKPPKWAVGAVNFNQLQVC